MKPQQYLIFFLLIGAVIVISATFQLHAEPQTELLITQMEIKFNGPNATANIEYDVGFLTQMYVLFFGSHNLDPYLEDFLYGFEEFRLVSVRGTTATVELTNVSRHAGQYYLHDMHPLGSPVSKLILVYPDNKTLTFDNTSETPNTFY